MDVAVATKVPIVPGFFATGDAKYGPITQEQPDYIGGPSTEITRSEALFDVGMKIYFDKPKKRK